MGTTHPVGRTHSAARRLASTSLRRNMRELRERTTADNDAEMNSLIDVSLQRTSLGERDLREDSLTTASVSSDKDAHSGLPEAYVGFNEVGCSGLDPVEGAASRAGLLSTGGAEPKLAGASVAERVWSGDGLELELGLGVVSAVG